MNEKLKELVYQADFIGKKINGDEWRWGYIDPELNSKLEKFAELIVKDVLIIADNFELEVNHSGLVDSIKYHFGVE